MPVCQRSRCSRFRCRRWRRWRSHAPGDRRRTRPRTRIRGAAEPARAPAQVKARARAGAAAVALAAASTTSATASLAPIVIFKPKPKYTADAMRAKVQGTVTMSAVVMPDGSRDGHSDRPLARSELRSRRGSQEDRRAVAVQARACSRASPSRCESSSNSISTCASTWSSLPRRCCRSGRGCHRFRCLTSTAASSRRTTSATRRRCSWCSSAAIARSSRTSGTGSREFAREYQARGLAIVGDQLERRRGISRGRPGRHAGRGARAPATCSRTCSTKRRTSPRSTAPRARPTCICSTRTGRSSIAAASTTAGRARTRRCR